MPAGRPSAIDKAGLDANLTQQRDGQWHISLRDDSGEEVFSGSFRSEDWAKKQARKWVAENYQVDTQESLPLERPRPAPKPKPRSLGPAPSHLVQMMMDRADDNEEKAIQYRSQADQLEAEAKRLREAAQALEGPDGHT